MGVELRRLCQAFTFSIHCNRIKGGSLWSTWKWDDWLVQKKKKRDHTRSPHTHKVHTFFRNCKVTEKGKKERKNGGKGGTYAPHWVSVLPGWVIHSVSPRLPGAQCPGSLHKAGGTSPRKLLLWCRQKRVISSPFFIRLQASKRHFSTKWPQT